MRLAWITRASGGNLEPGPPPPPPPLAASRRVTWRLRTNSLILQIRNGKTAQPRGAEQTSNLSQNSARKCPPTDPDPLPLIRSEPTRSSSSTIFPGTIFRSPLKGGGTQRVEASVRYSVYPCEGKQSDAVSGKLAEPREAPALRGILNEGGASHRSSSDLL